MNTATDVYWDTYDHRFARDPYPTYRRLRDEAPLYYNEKYDFYAVSRYDDVEAGLRNWQTFSSARGDILEMIKAQVDIPPGTLIFEDPPVHDIHRQLLARIFTPRRVAELEPRIRDFCRRALDPLVGADRFDLVPAIAAQLPMRVIGMLVGVPEADQEEIRDAVDGRLRTEAGGMMDLSGGAILAHHKFREYIDWRIDNPSDDLMTELLDAEFQDEHGVTRRLTRDEAFTYTTIVAGAGNETTGRLIGWLGMVLADHPEQRRELVEDPSLIPGAVEETLRYETTSPFAARYVTEDVEIHGRTVPAGSAMVFILSSANRDERRYPEPDRFDIHRRIRQPLTFGRGGHHCLGAALARLEGRIVLEEVLQRWPRWDVDRDAARMAQTSTVRGWESLPIQVG
jgi:cytochrome P450